jgi:hypothetical protein
MSSDGNKDWFTPEGARIFKMVAALEVVFSVGVYIWFRWYSDYADYALVAAAASAVIGFVAAFSAARNVSKAERASGPKQ